jgi:gas vesicle protein
MNTNQKFLAGIIIGVTVGAAILLLTKTDKGKEWLSDMSDAADDVKDNLKNKAGSLEKQFKDLIKKGKAFISDLEDKAKDITSSIAD